MTTLASATIADAAATTVAAEAPSVRPGVPGIRENRVLSIRAMAREQRRARKRGEVLVATPPDAARPRCRGDCENGERPCPWVSCRHHLYLDVTRIGSLVMNFPNREPDELVETCALDVAERGGVTLEETGALVNLTRERIRQMETRALDAARALAEQRLPDLKRSPTMHAIDPSTASNGGAAAARLAEVWAPTDAARSAELDAAIRSGRGDVAPQLCPCGCLAPLGQCGEKKPRVVQVAAPAPQRIRARVDEPRPPRPEVVHPPAPIAPAQPAAPEETTMPCSNCGSTAHNKRTCEMPTEPTKPAPTARAAKPPPSKPAPKAPAVRKPRAAWDGCLDKLSVPALLELRLSLEAEIHARLEAVDAERDAIIAALEPGAKARHVEAA